MSSDTEKSLEENASYFFSENGMAFVLEKKSYEGKVQESEK